MIKKLLSLMTLLFWASFSYSQNDFCVNAISLSPSAACNPVQGTFNNSTLTDAAPSCATDASQDVWYSFVATEKMMGISLTGTTGVSNGFEVFSGSCTGTQVI